MLQKRSSQRGMVRLATSVALSVFAALLGVSGCSADQTSDEGVGSVQQAIMCGNKLSPCPPDDTCGDWSCNLLTTTCVVKELTPDGEKCNDPSGATGICVSSQCVAGCYEKGSENGRVKIHQRKAAVGDEQAVREEQRARRMRRELHRELARALDPFVGDVRVQVVREVAGGDARDEA